MELSSVAFLGPAGSYTELALKEHLRAKSAQPFSTIAEVFAALASGKCEYGFVPIENVLQGSITETFDSLLRHKGQVSIVCSFLSRISHTLGVLPGSGSVAERASKITQIHSHDQALRQCAVYLRSSHPNAETVPANSTGAAAEHVAAKKLTAAAVIGAKETLLQHGFEIAAEDIADIRENKTRFALLGKGDALKLAESPEIEKLLRTLDEKNTTQVTSIALRPGRDRQGILFEVLKIISQDQRINLVSIHSRPDEKGVFVFYFDLEGHIREERIRVCLRALEDYCAQTTKNIAEVVLFGSYPQRKFYELPFKTIGIIGGAGVMGRWLADFFTQIGLEVLISDTGTELSTKSIAERAEVIVLSVPMSAFPEAIAELTPVLKAGQLVVENSSIKSCALPVLSTAAPAGVEVLGLHTMFGSSAQSLRGENVIITRTPASGDKAQALEDLLYKFGAKITYADVSTHDKMTAYLQSLFQVTLVALAEVMRKTFPEAAALEPFSTPNSRNILESMKRVVHQSDGLLKDLQLQNSEYPQIRRLFLQSIFQLLAALEHEDASSLLESARLSREYLK